MGFTKIIFDKYNTLVRHDEFEFPHISYQATLEKVYEIFGKENIFLSTNITEDMYDDDEETEDYRLRLA